MLACRFHHLKVELLALRPDQSQNPETFFGQRQRPGEEAAGVYRLAREMPLRLLQVGCKVKCWL